MPLTLAEIKSVAAPLGLDPCLVQAVVSVESRGEGFLPDGRPVILFEGHIFWREMEKRGINPTLLKIPAVLYPKWDKSKYVGGAGEHERLNAAALVNKEAALCSASWGLFQIMGFNHAACGFADVSAFVAAMQESEEAQLIAFCAFMRSQGLVPYLAAHDFAGFAKRYNGPGYAANSYDTKLRTAYEHCVKGEVAV